MGDAGPPTPDPLLQQERSALNGHIETDNAAPLREIRVLVTGFGVSLSFLPGLCVRGGAVQEEGES